MLVKAKEVSSNKARLAYIWLALYPGCLLMNMQPGYEANIWYAYWSNS